MSSRPPSFPVCYMTANFLRVQSGGRDPVDVDSLILVPPRGRLTRLDHLGPYTSLRELLVENQALSNVEGVRELKGKWMEWNVYLVE